MTHPLNNYRELFDIGTNDGHTVDQRVDKLRDANRRRAKRSLLEQERYFQKRVKQTRDANPDLPMRVLQERFNIGPQRLSRLLSDEPSFPKEYRIAAAHLVNADGTKKTIEEVTENKEKGLEWCRHCNGWIARAEFYTTRGSSREHSVARCIPAAERRRKTKRSE